MDTEIGLFRWKGNVPDFRNSNCPNVQTNVHTECGTLVAEANATFVKEEYLGINSICNSTRESSLCLIPRPAYFQFRSLWNQSFVNSSQDTTFNNNTKSNHSACSDPNRFCAYRPELLYFHYSSFMLICFFFVAFLSIMCTWIIQKCKQWRKKKSLLGDTRAREEIKITPEEFTTLVNNVVSDVAYCKKQGNCTCGCCLARKKVSDAIINYFQGLPFVYQNNVEKVLNTLTAVLWEKTMETYNIYAGRGQRQPNQQIKDIFLYTMINQLAMTINHCPETVAQVFHENKDKTVTQELMNEIKEEFGRYAERIQPVKGKKKNGYEDVNYESIQQSPAYANSWRGRFNKVDRLLECCRWKNSKKEFMNRSVFSFIYNYAWYVRLHIWLVTTSWYYIPQNNACFYSFLFYLSIIDICWNFVTSISHAITRFPHLGLLTICLPLLYHFVWLVALFYFGGKRPQNSAYPIDVYYIAICIFITFVWEFYLMFLLPCSFLLPGRRRSFFPPMDQWWDKAIIFLQNCIVYILMIGISWFVTWYIIVPSVLKVDFGICTCPLINQIPSVAENAMQCGWRVQILCDSAVVLLWAGSMWICLVTTYMVWVAVIAAFGVWGAYKARIGHINTWSQVRKKIKHIKTEECIISRSAKGKGTEGLWTLFVRSLYDEHLIPEEEMNDLLHKAAHPPINAEAKRRIFSFFNSLEDMVRRNKLSTFQLNFPLKSMPTYTTMIPIYDEAIFYSVADLLKDNLETESVLEDRTSVGSLNGAGVRITDIEYLVYTYTDEWRNFCQMLKKAGKTNLAPQEILRVFLDRTSTRLDTDVRIWASMRGQTLSRTLAGLNNCRKAFAKMEVWEGDGSKGLAQEKFQILICHQVNFLFLQSLT